MLKAYDFPQFANCEIIEDLTPSRRKHDKIYLCKCLLCGTVFTRCAKTLKEKRSDCGCRSGRETHHGVFVDKLLRNDTELSKRIMLARLNALKLYNAVAAYEALYINGKSYCEYTAISIGMSFSTLYRARRQIYAVWTLEQKRKAEIAQKTEVDY